MPVPSDNFVRALPSPAANSIASPCRLYSTSRVRRLPALPLRASPFPPVGLVPSRRHPWDFPLQRSDHILSRTTFRLALPFFSLAGRIIPPPSRLPFGHRFDWLDDSPVFRPVAPGCRTSRDGRLASRPSFEDRRARRHLTGAAPLAAGRYRVAPADGQKPEGFCIDAPIRRVSAA